jgi:hypothetical protein
MKNYRLFPFALCLLLPLVCQAQKLAQIDCPRQGGDAYLYSSTATMEIGATLKCGQQVHVLGRFDNFYHVRTDSGEDGFVPVDSISFVKAAPGAKTSGSRSKGKQPSASLKTETRAPAAIQEVVLLRQTPVHLKFVHTISSASAHVGEEVNFEVAEEVAIGGFVLIPKGAPATGTVTEAEPKRRMGHGGKLSVSVTSVRLADNEKAALRSVQEEKGASQKVGMVIPLMRGKDITFAEGTEITAYVDADMRLKTSKFHAAHAPSTAAAASRPN